MKTLIQRIVLVFCFGSRSGFSSATTSSNNAACSYKTQRRLPWVCSNLEISPLALPPKWICSFWVERNESHTKNTSIYVLPLVVKILVSPCVVAAVADTVVCVFCKIPTTYHHVTHQIASIQFNHVVVSCFTTIGWICL